MSNLSSFTLSVHTREGYSGRPIGMSVCLFVTLTADMRLIV